MLISSQFHIFQSTLPREERHIKPKDNRKKQKISIHAPTRGATVMFDKINYTFKYFNPRSHERSDFHHKMQISIYPISIHAPTRGATNLLACPILPEEISIHAPTRGATKKPINILHIWLFQSTLPREERRVFKNDASIFVLFQSTLPREERQQYCTKNLFIFIQYRQ